MKWLNKPTDTLFCPFNIIYYTTLKNCLFLTQQPKFIAVSKSAKQPLHICLNSYRNPSLHLKDVSELANCLDCKHNCWNIVERRRSEYCCSYRRLSTILWPFSHNLWWCTSFNPFNNLINYNSLLISSCVITVNSYPAAVSTVNLLLSVDSEVPFKIAWLSAKYWLGCRRPSCSPSLGWVALNRAIQAIW